MDQEQSFQDVDLLSGLDENDQEALASHAAIRSFRRNTVVMTAGDNTNSLYIVVSGRVKIYLDDERGREHILRTLGPGACFGELAMLCDGPRAANVATLENSRLAVISRADFMACLHSNPGISLKIIQSLVQRIREMTEDVSTLALLDVYGRVARVLTRSAREQQGRHLTAPMTHQEIANRIGSSREMVTRILRDLREGGYISTTNKQVVLEKPLPSGW